MFESCASKIGGRTEWIKLEGSVPRLYLCASLPATYPGGLSSKKIHPSKEWIIFWGVDKMGSVHQKYPEYTLQFYPLGSGNRKGKKR